MKRVAVVISSVLFFRVSVMHCSATRAVVRCVICSMPTSAVVFCRIRCHH